MILRALAYLDRHGPVLLAAGLAVGLALPPLAHAMAPLLPIFVFAITTSIMLRIEWPRVAFHARRPLRIALVVLWALVVSPVLIAAVARLLGLPAGLSQALVVWCASPPMTSLPAIAMLMGLDASLSLLVMVFGTFLMPLTLPPLVLGLIGLDLGIAMLPLMERLALFVLGAGVLALVLRRVIGVARLDRRAREINGFNVLLLVLFAIAIMDGMWRRIIEEPLAVLAYSAAAIGASAGLQAVSAVLFGWLERPAALTVGLIGGNKNMAMVWANLGAAVSPDLLLYFVCAQLPIYLLPAVLAPVYRRLGARRRLD
ncbi:MAG TPA: hypothetical protein VMU06_04225 [Stellaceae bacterium]|nr:hypothetical protein [Stellaceae bacterium]